MSCPIKLDKTHSQNCHFRKQGKCDYPYYLGMSESEIKKLTKSLGGKK